MIWVFGGTAVGKKRFINEAVARQPGFIPHYSPLKAVWMQDGESTAAEVLAQAAGCEALVRWQWGRERIMTEIITAHPKIGHVIYLLSANLVAQLSRVMIREGELKWNADSLAGEANSIASLVHDLSAAYKLPVVHVDTSSPSEYALRWRLV